MPKTTKPKPKRETKTFDLGRTAIAQLQELADKLHAGNATATLREIIRRAYEERVLK